MPANDNFNQTVGMTSGYIQQMAPAVCPACGRCPTCGHVPATATQPHVTWPISTTWSTGQSLANQQSFEFKPGAIIESK
jgi:hypothetical protein